MKYNIQHDWTDSSYPRVIIENSIMNIMRTYPNCEWSWAMNRKDMKPAVLNLKLSRAILFRIRHCYHKDQMSYVKIIKNAY